MPQPNVPVPPCRIVDTRTPVVSPIPSGGFRNFSISGLCGVPTRAIHGLAENLNALGQLGESEQLLRKALDIHTKLYREQHLDTANMVNSLASLLHDLKRYEEADVLYRRALVVQEALQGENGPAVAITVNNLAILSQDRGDLSTAETMFRRSLAARVKLYGESSPQTTRAKDNLGALLMAKKQYAAAESIFRETVAAWEALSGEAGPSPNLATARFRLALALARTQGASVGAKLAEQAIGEVRRLLPEGSLSRKKMEQEEAC